MNVTASVSVLTVVVSLKDETVDSFDASKRAAFRGSIAAVLEVDASTVELTIRELLQGMEGSVMDAGAGSGSYGGTGRRLLGRGIEIVVTVRSTEATAIASASASARTESFSSDLSSALRSKGIESEVEVDASSVVVAQETAPGAPTPRPTPSPTASPTLSPTASPTGSPTSARWMSRAWTAS